LGGLERRSEQFTELPYHVERNLLGTHLSAKEFVAETRKRTGLGKGAQREAFKKRISGLVSLVIVVILFGHQPVMHGAVAEGGTGVVVAAILTGWSMANIVLLAVGGLVFVPFAVLWLLGHRSIRRGDLGSDSLHLAAMQDNRPVSQNTKIIVGFIFGFAIGVTVFVVYISGMNALGTGYFLLSNVDIIAGIVLSLTVGIVSGGVLFSGSVYERVSFPVFWALARIYRRMGGRDRREKLLVNFKEPQEPEAQDPSKSAISRRDMRKVLVMEAAGKAVPQATLLERDAGGGGGAS